MMNILRQITRRYTKVEPLPEGTHHKQAVVDEKPYRIHLRLRKDGSGVLIVNAMTVLHLNPTAAEYAFHFVKGSGAEEAARQVAARYRVDMRTALADFNDFSDRIHALISTPDQDPVSYLGFDRARLHSSDPGSPLRLDCALTYRLPADSPAQYAPVKRVARELTTQEWQVIMDKAWQAGIPHVILTGGEATLREDLPELIAYAEGIGQVCGLLTDGLKLAQEKYLEKLLQSGLDHVMLIMQGEDPRAWKAIETIVPQDLFLTVHLTLDRENAAGAAGLLEKIAGLGVKHLSLSTSDDDLQADLIDLQNQAGALQLSLHWDLPVPYSASNPVAVETREDEIPAGAGRAWLYVEPDGDVLPAQGQSERVLGNLLREDWAKIAAALQGGG
jgi:hypothetical protein